MVAASQLPTMNLNSPSGFRFNKRLNGWKLLEDTPLEGNPQLSLSSFLEDDEIRVYGETMVERSENAENQLGKCAGQHHLEAMLDHPEDIPAEWRKFCLVAPRTKWRESHNKRCVACLCWDRDRWVLVFRRLSIDWRGDARIVRISQVS